MVVYRNNFRTISDSVVLCQSNDVTKIIFPKLQDQVWMSLVPIWPPRQLEVNKSDPAINNLNFASGLLS